MTDQQNDSASVDWGPLGEAWWREAAKSVGASELQMRFACAKHRGASNTAAMRAAGSKAGEGSIRQTAYRTFRCNAVQRLLALAAAEAKGGTDGTVDGAEARRILSGMARGADPNVKIRAVEALMKLEDRSAEVGRVPDDDGFATWRMTRDYLRQENGAGAIVLLWIGSDQGLAGMPLLHDVASACRRTSPEVWDAALARMSVTSRAFLDARLANPAWQREARAKFWREIGIDIDAAALPAGIDHQQAAVAGFNGRGAHVPASGADARE